MNVKVSLVLPVLAMGLIGCGGSKKPATFADTFDSYAKVYDACLNSPDKTNKPDCSEFDSDSGPLFSALVAGSGNAANKKQLIEAAEQGSASRQEAAFRVLERVLSRSEMLPICRKIAENVNGPTTAMVHVYMTQPSSKLGPLKDRKEEYRTMFEILHATILQTKWSGNVNLVANSVQDFAPPERRQITDAFESATYARVSEAQTNEKLVRSLLANGYYHALIPANDFPKLRHMLEEKVGREKAEAWTTFTGSYCSQVPKP